ncbi:MAG: alpha/beta fold hydrolase [Pyrinomonadaceae bacterium]
MVITLNVVGQYGIRVNNPGGQQSNTFNFNVQAASPSISSISPSSPTRSDSDQNVQVSGSNFQSGLTVTVFIPGGGTATLSGSQIQSVTPTSFTMVITLNVVGQYGIRVNNPGGAQSNTFNFNVQAANPSISSISPSSPTRSDSDQNVQVSGSTFQSGLTVTVFIPGGGSATLSGSQIQSVTSSSFTMVITLNVVGQYGIRVNNPGGAQSNTFNFNVQNPTSPLPTVGSISPGTPQASASDQNVTVVGTNFQQNLTVSVNFPGGGSALLSGTQIQSVTSTSFVMRILLGAPGSWSVRVNNPNGGQSNVFNFTVQSVIQAPVIFSLNPSSPFVNASDQDVYVSGANFQPNLNVTVNYPGGSSTLSGTQIQNLTSSSFLMRVTLGVAGSWSIRVNNTDGGQSAFFNFNVSAGSQNPSISSINPSTPMSQGADQNVIVNGSNFQAGLRVDVSFPSGGVSTLQGTGQIQSVTSNSFLMRITLNAPGSWTIRVINQNGSQSAQFGFNVQSSTPPPSGLPSSILSPVIGPLRVTTSNQGTGDGKWEFNQHKTGSHTATGGISLSNDTLAWDVNLYAPASGNADAGKAVFAVADGVVVSYVGTPPGSGPGAVLIAHPNAQSPVWFSGYLHMANVRVSLNQEVSSTTVIGEVGRIGANNDHLHFVVYSGQNTRGNLQSFNATLSERIASTTNAPTITSIEPAVVNQSSTPQLITISGSNFQPSSIIEAQAPNGQFFSVTPEAAASTSGAASSKFDVQPKITAITSSTITARVLFGSGGTYAFSVLNRPTTTSPDSLAAQDFDSANNAFALSNSNTVRVIPSGRTPVILIPGIMGSRIAKREGGGFRNLWLGGANGTQRHLNHLELKNDVENPNVYRDIANRPVVATEILRNLSIEGVTIPKTDIYDRLITYLMGVGYTPYDVTDPNQRTKNGCDKNQVGADLFVFPYDWRNSNWTSARDLYEYVECIRSIRKNPADFKVHIIAHSMGGLVARRYILNFPGNVERMVSLGTPWLGSPKFLHVLEFGGEWDNTSFVIPPGTMKELAPHIRGAHELIPSKAYVDDLVTLEPFFPFGEDSWTDFDFDPARVSKYNFSRLKAAMNVRYANRPGDATDIFHSQTGQDDWSKDAPGVSYFNFVGYGKSTIVSIKAKRDWVSRIEYFDLVKTSDGDGTVPLVSALRNGRRDYRGPIKLEKGFPLNHGELTSNGLSFGFINCVVNVPDAEACIKNGGFAKGAEQIEDSAGTPSYELKTIGSQSVTISDSFGNTTSPFSTSLDEGVGTVQADVTGDSYLSATFPLDQSYRVVLKSPARPVSILLTKSDGQIIAQAIRYVDITLPPNVLALIELTPQGVTLLKYDSDGDGTFETSVNPTISVTGVPAQDVESPVVAFNETIQGGASQISLAATDAGTGVERIMYSTNGTTYQPYTSPLLLNPAQTPIVYAFADDKVANRSGVFTYSLTGTSTLPLALALEENGQTSAALDSVLHTRDPFQAINPANVLNISVDKNTRLVVFVTNLQLAAGEPPSSVVVNLVDAAGMGYDIPAEDVRLVPNVPLTQIIFRLPNNLASGTVALRVRAQTRLSDAAIVRIAQ